MTLTPEQRAREAIDALLRAAGWIIQDNCDFNRNAAEGVAVREFPLPRGACDYLLFVGGKAAGVIEAKKSGVTLSGVAEQASKYNEKLSDHLARCNEQLAFDYESTGEETYFRDTRDPHPRSRRVFAFHQPPTLHAWLKEPDTLRHRLLRTVAGGSADFLDATPHIGRIAAPHTDFPHRAHQPQHAGVTAREHAGTEQGHHRG